MTGNLNEDDKRENQQLLDDYHFEKIVRELRSEDEYAQFEPDDIIEEKARAKFKSMYGYEYRKGWNLYPNQKHWFYIPSWQENEAQPYQPCTLGFLQPKEEADVFTS